MGGGVLRGDESQADVAEAQQSAYPETGVRHRIEDLLIKRFQAGSTALVSHLGFPQTTTYSAAAANVAALASASLS
jgi:hypothetical protein